MHRTTFLKISKNITINPHFITSIEKELNGKYVIFMKDKKDYRISATLKRLIEGSDAVTMFDFSTDE